MSHITIGFHPSPTRVEVERVHKAASGECSLNGGADVHLDARKEPLDGAPTGQQVSTIEFHPVSDDVAALSEYVSAFSTLQTGAARRVHIVVEPVPDTE